MVQSNTNGTPWYEYPQGHLGHLTDDESHAFDELKVLCEQAGYSIPTNGTFKPSYDDATLLRFLRARRFVPNAAFEHFKSTVEWRKAEDIDNWYNTIDVEEYENTRLLYTHWTGRRDRLGIPLYVFEIGALDSKRLSAYDSSLAKDSDSGTLNPKLRRLFATYEHLTNFVFPLCSSLNDRPFPETPISQTCCIVDISGVGLRQFWTLKTHLEEASVLASAHYPETLGHTFIVGAPAFFPTIWSWIKRWFDPVTVSKISIVPSSAVKSTLEERINISDIPKKYGGTLDWDFGQLPMLDEETVSVMKMKDGSKTLPKGPIRWRGVEAHALGSVLGEQRDEVVAEMPSAAFA